MSEISTDKITPRIKSATKITQIDADSKFPAGHIIQVVQDSWQGKTSSLSNSSVWTATGLEKDIH